MYEGVSLSEPHIYVLYVIDDCMWIYIYVSYVVQEISISSYENGCCLRTLEYSLQKASDDTVAKSIETKPTYSLPYSTPTGMTLRRSTSNIATSQSFFRSVFV